MPSRNSEPGTNTIFAKVKHFVCVGNESENLELPKNEITFGFFLEWN